MLLPGRLAESGNTPADRTAITEIRSDRSEGDHHDPGHHDSRGRRPIPGRIRHQGADKRALHGSKGSTVFRDPTEENRMWVLFEWDEEGWANFVSDPEVPPILKEAGHLSKPQTGSLLGQYRA
jgi:hypothetical protein